MVLHPLMLAWLGGAAVPLLLHLLSRSQFRAVNWGAMMFLTGPDTGARHWARVRQWILLVVRMMLVGLLATALARPVIASRFLNVPTAGLTSGGTAAVVIILDDSPSMGYMANGQSRLDLGRQVTLQILSALKRGDQASLILSGSRDPQAPAPPTLDLQSIASKVSELQPELGQSDFASDLLRAADLLDHSGPSEREIYLICDRQAIGWRNLNDVFRQRWNARREGGMLPRVTLIPVGDEQADNLAIDAVEFPDRPVFRNVSTSVQVRIHNYGPAAAKDVPVSIWIGTDTIYNSVMDVPARSTRTVTANCRFNTAGSKVISAALRSQGLTSDDRLDSQVDVVDRLRVLHVTMTVPTTPAAGTAPTTGPSAVPRNAVDAALFSAAAAQDQQYAVDTVSAQTALTIELLRRYSVLLLDDVPRFTSAQAKTLQQFSDAGGGILVLPGSDVDVANYNSTLHGNGISLLPAAIKPAILKASHLVNVDHQHPVFRSFPAKPNPFAAVVVNRFFPSTPYGGDIHVLVKLTGGEPLMIDGTAGHGHVILLSSAQNRDWNSLADPALARQLLQAVVRYLGVNAAVDRNLWPGQQLLEVSDEPVAESSVYVQPLSMASREPVIITRNGARTEMRYSKTGRPGTYRLHYRTVDSEKVVNYVVSAGRNQSDLSPVTVEQWKAIEARIRLNRVEVSHTTIAAVVDNQRGGREIWIDLLGGVLGLLMLELLLARLWSR